MQDLLRFLPNSGRARPLPHVVESRFRPSRADALHLAHASLRQAEANLRHLASPRAAAHPAARPPLFRRHA
jgi:hypothetical protein